MFAMVTVPTMSLSLEMEVVTIWLSRLGMMVPVVTSASFLV
jgi:hypothetical protein